MFLCIALVCKLSAMKGSWIAQTSQGVSIHPETNQTVLWLKMQEVWECETPAARCFESPQKRTKRKKLWTMQKRWTGLSKEAAFWTGSSFDTEGGKKRPLALLYGANVPWNSALHSCWPRMVWLNSLPRPFPGVASTFSNALSGHFHRCILKINPKSLENLTSCNKILNLVH